MLHSPFVLGVATGFLSYAVTYGLMEQEFKRWKQYRRWKMNKVVEKCSTASGFIFGISTAVFNLI